MVTLLTFLFFIDCLMQGLVHLPCAWFTWSIFIIMIFNSSPLLVGYTILLLAAQESLSSGLIFPLLMLTSGLGLLGSHLQPLINPASRILYYGTALAIMITRFLIFPSIFETPYAPPICLIIIFSGIIVMLPVLLKYVCHGRPGSRLSVEIPARGKSGLLTKKAPWEESQPRGA
jgi:hypothetical protein